MRQRRGGRRGGSVGANKPPEPPWIRSVGENAIHEGEECDECDGTDPDVEREDGGTRRASCGFNRRLRARSGYAGQGHASATAGTFFFGKQHLGELHLLS